MNGLAEHITDEELIDQARGGNDDAVGALITRYLPLVRHKVVGCYGPGLEQDDLVQEGLIGLLGAIRGFDPQRAGSFATYATQCITNRIYSAVRAALSPKHSPLRDYMSISPDAEGQAIQIPSDDGPETSFIKKEDNELRDRRMQTLLSGYEQETLRLYLSGHTYQEISDLLHSSPKAVDNALQRVRRKLKMV